MAYAYALDPTEPANTDLVQDGAADMRLIKNALIERVESFFQSVNNDPWQVKSGVTFLGNFTQNAGTAALQAVTATTVVASSTIQGTTITATVGFVGNLTGNVTGNASTATILQNTRTIWGQNFNGSANITGAFSGATTGNFSSTLTVSSGGIAVTGASTITGTLGGVTTFTVTTVTATNLGGTLSTAAQPNVTSLGTLTSVTVSGLASLGGTALIAGTGTTSAANSTLIRNNGTGQSQIWGLGPDATTIGTLALVVAESDLGNSVTAVSISSTTTTVSTATTAVQALTATVLTLGTNASSFGTIRLPNANYIAGKNAANNANISMISVTAADKIGIDPDAVGTVFGAGAVFAGALSGVTTLNASGLITGQAKILTTDGGNATTAAVQLGSGANGISLPAANTVAIVQNSVSAITISGSQAVAFAGALSGVTTYTGTGLIQTTVTTEQMRLRYDASNYASFTVNNVQALTISMGGSASMTFGAGAATVWGNFYIAVNGSTAGTINLASGIAPASPMNGDIWFDGTNYKGRIAGVTKTFTVS